MSEMIVGVIPHLLRSTGGIGSTHYTLIATNQRLIVARFTNQMMQEAMAQSKAKANNGGGLLGKILAGRVLTPGDVVDYTNKYWAMAPETVIGESQGNFAMNLDGIIFIEVVHQIDQPDEDSHIRADRYILNIETITGKYSYIFDADPQDMNVLWRVLRDKLRGLGRSSPIRPVSPRHY